MTLGPQLWVGHPHLSSEVAGVALLVSVVFAALYVKAKLPGAKMEALFRALGFGSKPEYAEKIPENLTEDDFRVHKVKKKELARAQPPSRSSFYSPVRVWLCGPAQIADHSQNSWEVCNPQLAPDELVGP